jgi:hypothetical protein
LVDDFESKLKDIFRLRRPGRMVAGDEIGFEALGADHICFGSDYPYELMEPKYVKKIIHDINRFDVPQKDRKISQW